MVKVCWRLGASIPVASFWFTLRFFATESMPFWPIMRVAIAIDSRQEADDFGLILLFWAFEMTRKRKEDQSKRDRQGGSNSISRQVIHQLVAKMVIIEEHPENRDYDRDNSQYSERIESSILTPDLLVYATTNSFPFVMSPFLLSFDRFFLALSLEP